MSKYKEEELRSAAVTIIDEYGQMNTSELSNELRYRLNPSGHDLEIIAKRTDDYFSQKVRNLVSHLDGKKSISNYVDVDQSVIPAVFTSRRFKEIVKNYSEAERKKIIKQKAIKARTFTGRFVDFENYRKENSELGLAGELFYLNIEIDYVRKLLGDKMSDLVIHSSMKEGDGTGYDILSFNEVGIKHIEVKTTKNKLTTPFYMSYNEKTFFDLHGDTYYLVRIYEFDIVKNEGKVAVYHGDDINSTFDFSTQSYRVTFK